MAVTTLSSWIVFPQDSVNTQYAVRDEGSTSVSACCETCPPAMCFLMMEGHLWWPQWIHLWCWIALCGFPPLWAAGSCCLSLGLNWRCCLTQSWPPWCSAACCSELWIVTSSHEVWSHRWLPGLWIHVSAWRRLYRDVSKITHFTHINSKLSCDFYL